MRSRLTVAVVVAAVFAVSCGGDAESDDVGSGAEVASGDDADQEPDVEPDQGADAADSSVSSSGDSAGVYTVDGESFAGDLFNCDPSGGAGDAEPGDLELLVLSGPGKGLSIDAWHSQGLRQFEVRLNRATDVVEEYETAFSQGADGSWTANSSPPVTLDEAPFTVDGNRIVGEVTLQQEVPQDATGSVAVTFDFEIPEMSC